MKNIVIFASGSGSNAETIINHFQNDDFARVVAVFTNKPDAGVIQRAINHKIPFEIFLKTNFKTVNF